MKVGFIGVGRMGQAMIRPHDARGRWDHADEGMGAGWLLGLGATLILLTPVIVVVWLYERCTRRRWLNTGSPSGASSGRGTN